MKKTYVLIFSCFLVACSDRSHHETQNSLNDKQTEISTEVQGQQSTDTSENLALSETKDKLVTNNESDQADQISCSSQNITKWYGFDESSAEPKCEVVKNFNLPSYKCDVSKNAFGTDKDAILLENNDQNIFVYSDDKICNEMLEIRNSNAP